MVSIEPSDDAALVKAFKANRVVALVMAAATAALLLLLRPELALVYVSYVGISVCSFSLVRTYGVFVKPYPVKQQNFAAYVSVSTIGFLATLIGAPQVIELHGAVVYFLFFIVMAGLLLRAIFQVAVRASR